jgi:DNA topoisomerase-1
MYLAPNGETVRNRTTLARIRALAIPPAWADVWICPDPRGYIQATGRDARRRKQYRYHAAWRAHREETKYSRLLAFAVALRRIRARTRVALARPGLPREKVLATVVQLLEKSLIRVGNDEYVRQNASFGLTTLRDKHVAIRGCTVRFDYKGKSGKHHTVSIDDQRIARVIRQCRDLPGYELFQYIDEERKHRRVTSTDVNAYLKAVAGESFTAKDFRTWAGTVLMVAALRALRPCTSRADVKRTTVKAVEAYSDGSMTRLCSPYKRNEDVVVALLKSEQRALRKAA